MRWGGVEEDGDNEIPGIKLSILRQQILWAQYLDTHSRSILREYMYYFSIRAAGKRKKSDW